MILLTHKDDYENLSPRNSKIIENHLEFVLNNVPYYRDRVDLEKLNNKNFYDFPLTKGHDLIKEPFSFIANKRKTVQFTSSGGTYGKRKIMLRTERDIKESVETAVSMFKCGGLNQEDTVGILQPFDLWNIGHIALEAFRKIGALSIPIGLSVEDKAILEVLKKMKVDTLYGTPSKLAHLAKLSKKEGVNLDIEKVFCAGEPILPEYRRKINKNWQAEIYGIYGSEETDGIGAECENHDGYHIFEDNFIIEILNPETKKPAESNEGALVVTKLNSKGTVLTRYLLGDIVKVEEEVCKCGREEIRIKPKGRLKRTVWLQDGRKVTLAALEETLEEFFNELPQYQARVKKYSSETVINLKIKSEEEFTNKGELKNRIQKASQDLREGVSNGEVKLKIGRVEKVTDFQNTIRDKIPKLIYE